MSKTVITNSIGNYGEVLDLQEEKWTGAYRYKVCNGIMKAIVNLKRHIPSHLTIAGHRALIDYEGQPKTCYACNEMGHLVTQCPQRVKQQRHNVTRGLNTWAGKMAGGAEASEIHTIEQTQTVEERVTIERERSKVTDAGKNIDHKQVEMDVVESRSRRKKERKHGRRIGWKAGITTRKCVRYKRKERKRNKAQRRRERGTT
jgi:hypothetical protein